MSKTVRNRAEFVATLRSIEVTLMEMLARWVPTTPLMEAKIAFGRHIWETAQHADALGKRTFELRAPMHLTLAPAAPYRDLLAEIASLEAQAERVSAFYDVLLPAVKRRCESYVTNTDAMLDEPTVRIMKRIASDCEAMIEEGRELREGHSALVLVDARWREALIERERAIADLVDHKDGEVARG